MNYEEEMTKEEKDYYIHVYRGVPIGWSANEIIEMHEALNGSFPINNFEIERDGAPDWMVHRYEWQRYRETLRYVAKGIRAGDAACIEIAIAYIELDFYGSYSGFIRKKLSLMLRIVDLSEAQKMRLNTCFLDYVKKQKFNQEFVQGYLKCWRQIITKPIFEEVQLFIHNHQNSQSKWLLKNNNALFLVLKTNLEKR